LTDHHLSFNEKSPTLNQTKKQKAIDENYKKLDERMKKVEGITEEAAEIVGLNSGRV